MSNRFEAFARTPFGRRLNAIVTAPERYAEYRAFSREGYPALTAIVSLLRPELEPFRHKSPSAFSAAKQFCGWAVATIMREHGHEMVSRSRVPGTLFTVGSIWSGEPQV